MDWGEWSPGVLRKERGGRNEMKIGCRQEHGRDRNMKGGGGDLKALG
jgi:hypothetical protein